MNLKNFYTHSLGLSLAALFAVGTGCSKAPATETAAEAEHARQVPWHFVEGRGILLTGTGRELVGLKTADVGYGRVSAERKAGGRVFRPATDGTPAEILVRLPEARARGLEAGNGAQASRRSAGDRAEFEGSVKRVDREVARATGQVELVIALNDPEGRLRAGDFLDCRMRMKGGGEVTTVPKSSILDTARGDFVYVKNGEYWLLSPVTVGGMNADEAEILEGLFEGDVVASAGLETLWLTELQAINGGVPCAHGH